MSRTLVAALVTCVFLASSAAVLGYVYAGYKWNVSPVVVYVNPANADVSPEAAEAALKVGMNAWNGVAGFTYVYGGRVNDTSTATDGRNVVIFRNATNGSAVATTYSWSQNGYRFDSDTVFWDSAYRFWTATSGCTYGAYIEDIAAHEFGHTVGLKHSADTSATMYATYQSCSTAWRTLAADDIAGLRSIYPQ